MDSALLRVTPDEVVEASWALLGRDADGTVLFLAAAPPESDALDTAPDEIWLGLRDLGGRIDGQESELLIGAIALAGWLGTRRSVRPAVGRPSCSRADGRGAASCAGASTSRARIQP